MAMTGDIERRVATLESIAEGQQEQIGLLTLIAERQQTTLERLGVTVERLGVTVERLGVTVERLGALLEEVKRDTAQTQRLWVNLSKKYGWLDDEDLT